MRQKILLCFLPLFIIATRLAVHVPNFVPMTAIALMSGAYLGKKWALVLPLAGLFISDLILGLYDWRLMLSVYGTYAVIGLFSWWLKKNLKVVKLIATTLLSAIFFFISTNLAVWFFFNWYTKDWAGLLTCFQQALPFFRYTLLGDCFYVAVLFGSYELIKLLIKRRQLAKIS